MTERVVSKVYVTRRLGDLGLELRLQVTCDLGTLQKLTPAIGQNN